MHCKLARFTLAASLAALVAGQLVADHGVAFADDDDDKDEIDEIAKELAGEPSGDSSVDSSGGNGGDSSRADATSAGGGPGSLGHTMAISTTFPSGGDAIAANFLYGLNRDAFLNLNLGVNFDRYVVIDPLNGEETVNEVGLQLGAGYRMYQGPKGKIRPYIEPGARVLFGDFGDFNNSLEISAYGNFGVDMAVTDQFTLGAAVGALLLIKDDFATVDFGLNTAAINATFWW